MKSIFSALLLSLLAGAAAAQQDPHESLRAYELKDGQLVRRELAPPPAGSPRPSGRRRLTLRPAPGSYRSETYALRVQVPAPHPDSVAVVSPGPGRDELPRQPLPRLRLVPEERRRGQ